jgi:general L-amino acid transport system permease protein
VAFVLIVVAVLRELYLNVEFGMRRRGQDMSYDYLGFRAGFGIREQGIPYRSSESYLKAYMVGVVNTVRIALSGIVFASVLGLVMGVARLSPNWLVRKIAQVYVEVLRNTPLVIQLIFLYVGVILALPAIGGGFHIPGVGFLSNRGAAITTIRGGEGFGMWVWFFLAGIIAAYLVRRWRTAVNERTGDPHYRTLWSLGTLLAFSALGLLLVSDALVLDVPELAEGGRRYLGGAQMSGQFAALLIGLAVYTSAFIAEIIRGSILAVEKGQKEAAEALGLRPGQQLRLVVLPQALRIAIPPVNSQYLNLTKNTSLAIAIGFDELLSVSKVIMNQSGRQFQQFLIVITTYLILSLIISTVMNIVNRAVTTKGRR